MRITFWKHSGFSIETDRLVILVDYIGGGFKPDGRHVLALISHAHGDHRRPELTAFADQVLDCPGEGRVFDAPLGARIRTFGSTDEGVSFLIELDNRHIFHAGDLNLWHWKDEGDADWTRRAYADFDSVLDTLAGERVDVAMFPVDPRQGSDYDEGARIFLERIRPGILIPMHFWEHPEAAEKFAKRHTNVRALTESGAYLEI